MPDATTKVASLAATRGEGSSDSIGKSISKRNKENIPARVQGIVYDPGRTCHLALLAYADGEKALILAPLGLNRGDQGSIVIPGGYKGGQRQKTKGYSRGNPRPQH